MKYIVSFQYLPRGADRPIDHPSEPYFETDVYAGGRRGGGCPGGRDFRQRQARRRDAGLGRRQAEAAGEDPAGDGGAGGGRQAGGGGRASYRGRKGTAAPSRRPQEAGQTGGAATG